MAEAAPKEQHELRLLDNVKDVANASIELLLQTGQSARSALKRPTIRATVVGAVVAASTFTVGAMPTAIGCAAGYLSYRLFRAQQRHQVDELR